MYSGLDKSIKNDNNKIHCQNKMNLSERTHKIVRALLTGIEVEQRVEEVEFGRPIAHAVNVLGMNPTQCQSLDERLAEVRTAFAAATGTRMDRLPEDVLLWFTIALERDLNFPHDWEELE